MYNLIKFPLFTALSVLAIAGTASAQDTFEVTISRTPGATAEVNYSAIKKQVRRYCKREARGIDGRYTGIRQFKFRKRCTAELMDKAIAKFNDPVLMAYHNAQTGKKTLLAAANPTDPSSSN